MSGDAALREALLRRMDACRDLAAGEDNARDVQLALIIRQFDLASVIRTVLTACRLALPSDTRAWAANFTKVVVLAGAPTKLAGRHRLTHADGDATACLGPVASASLDPLRRLLRPLQTQGGNWLPAPLCFPLGGAAGARLELAIAYADADLPQFLITVSHVIAEAYLRGDLADASALLVKPVAQIDAYESDDRYVRVHNNVRTGHGLQIFARLFNSLGLSDCGPARP